MEKPRELSDLHSATNYWLLAIGFSLTHGRGGGVGRGLGVGVGLGAIVEVGVAVAVAVAVGVGVNVAVAVAVAVAVGVGVGVAAQYRPPLLKKLLSSVPPQTIISLPAHTAV